MMRSVLFLTIGAVFATAACSRKPDSAQCAAYYGHLVSLQQSGNKGILAALKTAEGKKATLRYCSELSKSQVDCASKAASLEDASSCESGKGKGTFDLF